MKKDEIPYLRCYKMTYDTGFAPNPYHGVLTLATCKPDIRLHANKGDWIAGFTAKEVHDSNGKIHRFNGDRKLIYLACIKDKLKLEEYWESEDYKILDAIADEPDYALPAIDIVDSQLQSQSMHL
jgi:hypothetical protein